MRINNWNRVQVASLAAVICVMAFHPKAYSQG